MVLGNVNSISLKTTLAASWEHAYNKYIFIFGGGGGLNIFKYINKFQCKTNE